MCVDTAVETENAIYLGLHGADILQVYFEELNYHRTKGSYVDE